MSYATRAEFKAAVGFDDTLDDTVIQRALDSATEWIDGYCGRTFGPVSTSSTRTFDADNSRSLSIPDAATVTAVTIDSRQDGTYATTLAASQYQLYPLDVSQPGVRGGYREIRVNPTAAQAFWPGYQVRVTGTWGYGSIPASVEEACILLANRYFRRSMAPFGVIQAPESGEIARLPQNDPDVKALLADFRAPFKEWVAV